LNNFLLLYYNICFSVTMFAIRRIRLNLSLQRQFKCSSMNNKEVILHNLLHLKNRVNHYISDVY